MFLLIKFVFFPILFLGILCMYAVFFEYAKWKQPASSSTFASSEAEKIKKGLQSRPYTVEFHKESSLSIELHVMTGLFLSSTLWALNIGFQKLTRSCLCFKAYQQFHCSQFLSG